MNDNTNDIGFQRLDDFKKILTYRLVTKIKYHFKGNVDVFYKCPAIWKAFRNRQLEKSINPFKLIAKFNDCGLSRQNVRAIFGKFPNTTKFLKYKELIESDSDISVREHGTLIVKGRKNGDNGRAYNNVYLLPKEFIKSIFDNQDILEKVINANSGYYTDRQKRLIFTVINNKKNNYHYKTNKEIAEEKEIKDIIADFDFDEII